MMVLKIEKRVDPNEMPQYSFAAFAYVPIWNGMYKCGT